MENDATPDTPARDKGGAHLEWHAERAEEFPVAGDALGPPARGFTENADRRAVERARRTCCSPRLRIRMPRRLGRPTATSRLRQSRAATALPDWRWSATVSAGQPHASTRVNRHRSPQTSCQLPVVLIARQPSYGQPPNLRHEPLRLPGRSHDVIVARSGRTDTSDALKIPDFRDRNSCPSIRRCQSSPDP